MFNFRNVFFLLSLSAIFTGFIAGQAPPPAPNSASNSSSQTAKIPRNFVSLDGGFSLSLPQYVRSYTGVKPVEGVTKGGSLFTWQTPEGGFTAGFFDYVSSPANEARQIVNSTGENLIESVKNNGGELISKREISFEGYPGLEIRMRIKEGATAVGRYYLVKNRMFTLSSGWMDGGDGSAQLKILDSFKLVDKETAIAKKLEEATPKSLPQSPITKKLKSDAEDNKLKGKVKVITEGEESLTGTAVISSLKKSSEDYYDVNGNQIKRIYFDYRGNPSTVTIYGFIDGMRVMSSGYLSYEYNPPPPAPPPMPKGNASLSMNQTLEVKPVDKRYSIKYEYNYDNNGRLSERTAFSNNGGMTNRTVYTYEGNKLDISSYNNEGKLNSKSIEFFDDKGNLTEKTIVHIGSNYPDTKVTYTYESFDEKGNWTKRTTSKLTDENGKQILKPTSATHRTITYYP